MLNFFICARAYNGLDDGVYVAAPCPTNPGAFSKYDNTHFNRFGNMVLGLNFDAIIANTNANFFTPRLQYRSNESLPDFRLTKPQNWPP